jgi:excisionase family DNA binding protein
MNAAYQEPAPPLRLRWGVKKIAQYLGISRRCTQDMLNRGEIRSARIMGGRWVASEEALKAEFTHYAEAAE